jgi:hypothetical protein
MIQKEMGAAEAIPPATAQSEGRAYPNTRFKCLKKM